MESFMYEDLSEQEEQEERGLLRRCFSCRSRKGTSWMSAAVLILNAVLAPGILSLPDAFSRAGGVGVAVTLQVLLLLFILGSLYTLVCCAQAHAQVTYPDVIRVVCGPAAEVASAVCVTFYCYLFCVCSLVLVGDQWEKFFSAVYGADFIFYWYMSRYFVLPTFCIVLILPLCFTRKVEFLTNFSMLGNVAVLYCVILVVVKYFITQPVQQQQKQDGSARWSDVISVVPIWCGNYQCHVEVIPIVSTLRQTTLRWLLLSLLLAVGVCSAFYTLTGVFGYLTFGRDVTPDLLFEYPAGPDVLVATIAIAFKMCMTYPIIHFCGRKAIENLWVRGRGLGEEEVVAGEGCRRVVITMVTFSVVLSVSLVVPNLEVVVPLLGSAAAVLMFIFPGCCLVQLYRTSSAAANPHAAWLAAAAMLMTSLGAFVVGFSWSDLVVQLMTSDNFLQTGEEALEEVNNMTTTTTAAAFLTRHGNG